MVENYNAGVDMSPVYAPSVICRYKPFMIACGKRQILIHRGTCISVEINEEEKWFKAEKEIVLDIETLIGSPLKNGESYRVFLVSSETGLTVAVDTADVPAGYKTDQVIKIGGFDTLCVNAGTGMSYTMGEVEFTHPLNGYMAGDILPKSVWCLNHRPYSDPKGMVYIPPLDFWCDIYLQSGKGPNTKSVYRGEITRSRQYVDFVEDQICVNKTLLNDEEFAAAMIGSNEKTAVLGAAGAIAGGAGGRNDTANRRMISIYGVEEGCGFLWQWLANTSAAGTGTGEWAAQNGGKGDFYAACNVLLAGGRWDDAIYCGSRARSARTTRASANEKIGGRGRSHSIRM
jgi:hypothetical protein